MKQKPGSQKNNLHLETAVDNFNATLCPNAAMNIRFADKRFDNEVHSIVA